MTIPHLIDLSEVKSLNEEELEKAEQEYYKKIREQEEKEKQ